MGVVTRPITPDDEAAWRILWRNYLEHYGTNVTPELTDTLFENLCIGAPHFAFIAQQEGAVIGFVHGLPHPSTWSLEGYCYLEDLYVAPKARGTGAGRALIEAVYAEADRRGLSRVYWHTETSNNTARRLYDKVATLSEFIQYRRKD